MSGAPLVCPWERLLGPEPSTLDFCEANVCGWVAEPANTWTCMAYVLVGLYVIARSRRDRGARSLWPIGASAIFVGLSSALYHASRTYQTEVLDWFSMFTFSQYVLLFAVRRALGLAVRTSLAVYTGMLVALLALMIPFHHLGVPVFAAQLVATLAIELRLARRARERGTPVEYRELRRALVVFAAALGFWYVDHFRVLCVPEQHLLHGHALWHVANSVCFWFMYGFCRQFGQR